MLANKTFFSKFEKKVFMEALRIEILNPKAKGLLQYLADMKLIIISESDSSKNELKKLLSRLRSKSKKNLSMKEITEEVELVRTQRYAKKAN